MTTNACHLGNVTISHIMILMFRFRQGQFLNVNSEKTSEVSFYKALTAAVSKWPEVRLTDYCCAESMLAQRGEQKGCSIIHVKYPLMGKGFLVKEWV